jgi:hypothetical protein
MPSFPSDVPAGYTRGARKAPPKKCFIRKFLAETRALRFGYATAARAVDKKSAPTIWALSVSV